MAVQLLLPLLKNVAKGIGKNKASEKIRESAIKKQKSLSKLKKNKVYTNTDTDTDNVEEKIFFKKKLTGADLKMKFASSSKPPIEKLKINLNETYNFLVKQNAHAKKSKFDINKERYRETSALKLNYKLKKLKMPSFKNMANNLRKVLSSTGNILDNIMEFATIIILGIVVNAIPKIIQITKQTLDHIVEFLTPIQSGFNLLKAWFTGELNQKEYDADKKRLNDSIKNLDKDGGLIDQLANKAGPFGGLIKLLKPLVYRFRSRIGGSKIVLAKEGGKEGFYNVETQTFTERQWTSGERKSYNESIRKGTSISVTGESGGEVTVAGTTNSTQVSGFPITSHYGRRTHPVTGEKGKLHPALDIGTPEGTAVALTHPGVITSSFLQGGVGTGYGNMIDAWVPALNTHFRFAHLKERLKTQGEKFRAGEILGYTGGARGLARSGSSTGPHLHLEVDNIKGGKPYGGGSKSLTYEMSKHVKLGSKSVSAATDGAGGMFFNPIKPIVDKYPELPSNNVTTHYYIQPYSTIKNEIISYPIIQNNSQQKMELVEFNEIWEE